MASVAVNSEISPPFAKIRFSRPFTGGCKTKPPLGRRTLPLKSTTLCFQAGFLGSLGSWDQLD